ncbi:hypothetical protein EJB05_37049, partial [Eragrostis curvula]
MALDLNNPPEEEEGAGVHHFAAAFEDLHQAHGRQEGQQGGGPHDHPGAFPAMNNDPYDSDSDLDVYADHVDVVFEEEELHGSSDEEEELHGSSDEEEHVI